MVYIDNLRSASVTHNNAYIIWDSLTLNTALKYKVTYQVGSTVVSSDPINVPSSYGAVMHLLTGLSSNTQYTVKVTLYDPQNNDTVIEESSPIPVATKFGPVTNVTASNVSYTSATVSWDANMDFASYKVISQDSAGQFSTTETITASNSVNLTNLLSDRDYSAYVYGFTGSNATGSMSAVSATVTFKTLALTAPGAPTGGVSAVQVGTSTSAEVSFGLPATNGGSPITGYKVAVLQTGDVFTGASSPITVTGLSYNQTYTFVVTATNAIGDSVDSATSNSVTVVDVVAPPPAPSGGGVPCFPAGVMIRTPHGEKAVETLKSGDLVLTAAGRAVPIRMHSYSLEETTPATAPYFIPAGAMGPKAPAKPLHLSPLHAFQVRPNVWWCAKEAAKHSPKIQQYGLGEPITYYHVECPNFLRDNLVADGVVVESFAAHQLTKAEKHNLYKFSKVLNGFVRSNPTATAVAKF
jgi:hypothetical protein